MNAIWATLSRELRAYFLSPLAYIVAALLLLVNGLAFWFIVTALNNAGGRIAPLSFFFGGLFFWIVVLFVTPGALDAPDQRGATLRNHRDAPDGADHRGTGRDLEVPRLVDLLRLPSGCRRSPTR